MSSIIESAERVASQAWAENTRQFPHPATNKLEELCSLIEERQTRRRAGEPICSPLTRFFRNHLTRGLSAAILIGAAAYAGWEIRAPVHKSRLH